MIYEGQDGQRIIFVRTPNTAGFVVNTFLHSLGFQEHPVISLYPVDSHFLTYAELRRCVRKRSASEAIDMEDYFTFTFVRNPYAWLWTWWGINEKQDFKSWVMSIPEQLEEDEYACGGFLRPQSDYMSPHINRIGHYENLVTDFISIASDMGLYTPEIDEFVEDNPEYRTEYDDEMRDVVIQVYHTDLKYGYTF